MTVGTRYVVLYKYSTSGLQQIEKTLLVRKMWDA